MSNVIKNRYDFVLLFDVKDGNPNGDPDAGNMPRMDPETGNGLVTDVCLKRKVRNYVQLIQGKAEGYDIFIKEKAVLNNLIGQAYHTLGVDLTQSPVDKKDGKDRKTKGEAQGSEVETGRIQMCKTYYDVRTFGAVLSTGPNAGQVRGPVQLTFARSISQVVPMEHSITRMAVATEAEAEKQQGDNRTMGRKFTIPYGLYLSHGFVSPSFAEQTGFSDDDLNLFWKALNNMFDVDRSAARGEMSKRKLIVFKHDSKLGDAPAHALFDMVKVTTDANPVRNYSDYKITIPTRDQMPKGVTVIDM